MSVVERYEGRTREALVGGGLTLTPDQLASRTLRAIDLHTQGFTHQEIAESLNTSVEFVSRVLENPLAKARIAELASRTNPAALMASNTITSLAPKAVALIDMALDGYMPLIDPKTGEPMFDTVTGEPAYQLVSADKRLGAAQDVLDRSAPTAKVSKSQTIQDNSLLDSEVLLKVKERYLKEMGLKGEDVLDVECEEVSSSIDQTGEGLEGDTPPPSCEPASGDNPQGPPEGDN